MSAISLYSNDLGNGINPSLTAARKCGTGVTCARFKMARLHRDALEDFVNTPTACPSAISSRMKPRAPRIASNGLTAATCVTRPPYQLGTSPRSPDYRSSP